MKRYYTNKELKRLRELRLQLGKAIPHSKEAVSIGRQIREIDAAAFRRSHKGPMPKWMRDFSEAIMKGTPEELEREIERVEKAVKRKVGQPHSEMTKNPYR